MTARLMIPGIDSSMHPAGILLSQSPHSPHILINPGSISTQPMIQTSLITGQLGQIAVQQAFPGSPCTLSHAQLHPATFSRLEDAKHKDLLTVYCNSSNDGKKISATLNKTLFGSGSKGACIRFTGKMLTPRQFEIECQLEQSRDWRRSIHCQGDTLKDLIKQGVLRPHAQSCVCNICSPDPNATNAVPKYEEEVTQRRINNKRNKKPDQTKPGPKRPRKDIFFPSESATPSMISSGAGLSRSLLDHPLFRSNLFSSFEQSDQSTLRTIVQQFDRHQAESIRRTKLLDEKIIQCERQLQFIKENANEERISSRERESQLFSLFSVLSDSVEKSESRRIRSIITPNGTTIPSSLALAYRNIAELKTPHSAPPESPVRNVSLNPDRRRTSSDTSLGRPKLSSQECSNVKCEKVAQWRCIGCEKAIYCGKDCQETHWTTGHEEECDGGG